MKSCEPSFETIKLIYSNKHFMNKVSKKFIKVNFRKMAVWIANFSKDFISLWQSYNPRFWFTSWGCVVILLWSSCILRRPLNLTKSPNFIWNYLVASKKIGRFFKEFYGLLRIYELYNPFSNVLVEGHSSEHGIRVLQLPKHYAMECTG